MYQRILVAVDGSEPAVEALRHGAAMAAHFQAGLTMLHVVEPPANSEPLSALPVLQGIEHQKEAGIHLLQQLAETLPAGVRHEHRVVVGIPADAILETAADQQADLIVIGTHGRRGISRLMLGSTAEAVLRRSTCPVMTIRHTQTA